MSSSLHSPADGPDLFRFVTPDQLDALVALARLEDLGENETDLTTELMDVSQRSGQAMMRARQAGTIAGGALLERIARAYDPAIDVRIETPDGKAIAAGAACAIFTGPLRCILQMERVALNFVTHLSGVATLTARYVQAVQGTKAKITDTRKTLPGLRALQKYAVVCGGGVSHRVGLHDAVLVKDNHVAHLRPDQLGEALAAMTRRARALQPPPKFIEVEVDTLSQLRAVLKGIADGPDLVLLDNMSPEELRQAVDIRNELAPNVGLEASGGVNLQTVPRIAATGVDRIAVGALTHSAPALDIGLDIR